MKVHRVFLARLAAVLGTAALALPAVNCSASGLLLAIVIVITVLTGKVPGEPPNHAVGFRGTRNNTGATVRTDRRLWPPFRWEGTLLLPNPDHVDLGGERFGVSLLSENFGPEYAGVELGRSGEGIEITATIGQSTGPQIVNTLTLSDARAADFAIENTGFRLKVFARRHGTGEFQELGAGFVLLGGFQPSLDCGALPNKTQVAYDNLRLTSAGRRPGLSPLQALREDVYLAADPALAALTPADGPAPDGPAALASLTTARERLDAAIAAAPEAGASDKAVKKLQGARKKLATAIAAVEGKKPEKAWFGLVLKAAKAIVTSTKSLE